VPERTVPNIKVQITRAEIEAASGGGVLPPFTCGHCGAEVPQSEPDVARNHCPACLWSRHVEIGEEFGWPPCGAMMRGADAGGGQAIWRCTGCGFRYRGPTDDYLFRAASGTMTFYPKEGYPRKGPSHDRRR
jgi:hypothetical protein